MSSFGTVEVDLRGVQFATATSGKGLGAYPGLALVFHESKPVSRPDRLPGYLDLGHWAEHASVPHTHSSNLVHALSAAVRECTPERLERIAASHRVHVYDQRGCGGSTRPFTRAPDGSFYEQLKAVESRLGLAEQIADIERIRRILGSAQVLAPDEQV